MMEKREVKEWLAELPEEFRESALKNMQEENETFKVETMSWAVHSAFVWSTSPEGSATGIIFMKI